MHIFGLIASALKYIRFSHTLSIKDKYNRKSLDLKSVTNEPAVYKITNINPDCSDYGKCYIGASLKPRTRIAQHFSVSPSSRASALNIAIRKFGYASFKFEILESLYSTFSRQPSRKAFPLYSKETKEKDRLFMRERENFYLPKFPYKYNLTSNATNAGTILSDPTVLKLHLATTSNSAKFLLKDTANHNHNHNHKHAIVITNLTNNQKFYYASFRKAAIAFNTSVKSIVHYNNCIRFFDLIPYHIYLTNYDIHYNVQPRTIITISCTSDPFISFSFNSYTNAATFIGCNTYKLKSHISNNIPITACSSYSSLTFDVSVFSRP